MRGDQPATYRRLWPEHADDDRAACASLRRGCLDSLHASTCHSHATDGDDLHEAYDGISGGHATGGPTSLDPSDAPSA